MRTHFCPNPESITTLGLAFSAFARHYSRNLVWFLFLCLLRCFSSAGSLDTPILFSTSFTVLHREGFPIRKSTDRSLFAAPRSLSQLVTSFFGFRCQGIRPVLFFAWTFPIMVLVLLLYSILLNCIWVSIINCFGFLHVWKGFSFFSCFFFHHLSDEIVVKPNFLFRKDQSLFVISDFYKLIFSQLSVRFTHFAFIRFSMNAQPTVLR